MVKVIDNDKTMLLENPHQLFPSLKSLNLMDLPKLESFCNRRCDLQLPSLEFVEIAWCPLLEQFSSMGSVVAPNLKHTYMDNLSKHAQDLNSAIQQLQEEIRRKNYERLEELTSSQTEEVEVDDEEGEIEDEEINEELTSSQTKVVEVDQEKGKNRR